MSYYFTSESVSCGHPDKMADQISDAILDAILVQDPKARVACECLIKTGMVLVAGEMQTQSWVDVDRLARDVVLDIGYDHVDLGFNGHSCAVLSLIGKQSVDISQGVDRESGETGAGDQGLMFGYAANETSNLMPAPIDYSHRLMKQHALVRRNGTIAWLRPDAKTQLTFLYENNQPVSIDTVVFSTQHDPGVGAEDIREAVIETIIKPVVPARWMTPKTRFLINPTGRFVIGGPVGDCGLTGRKIIVDTYGGASRHGGGCFSGKDPTKVDRSSAYAARYIAKNIVASGLAQRCEVQVAYAIGVAEPMSVYVTTFGTSVISDEKIAQIVKQLFDLRPAAIIEGLNLLHTTYQPLACYGHFGRDPKLYAWERLDRCEAMIDLAGVSHSSLSKNMQHLRELDDQCNSRG